MPISIKDLPERYQEQVSKKILQQQGRGARNPVFQKAAIQKALTPEKERKYRNQPTTRISPSGAVIHFDSKKEAERYDYLILRQKAGEIRRLKLQADFTLQEAYTDENGNRIRAIRYRADFFYEERDKEEESQAKTLGFECESWRHVIEDVKSSGTRTDKYAIKKKLLKERFGYEITEI